MEYVSLSAITLRIVEFSISIKSPKPAGVLSKTGAAGVAGVAGPLANASSISALIILPFGPVPVIVLTSTPDDFAKPAANGLTKSLPPLYAGALDGAAAGIGAAAFAGAAAAAGAAAGVGAAAAISSAV